MLPVAIVLDVPEGLCAERKALPSDCDFGRHVLWRQHGQLRRGLRGLSREGFRTVHVLTTAEEVAGASMVHTRLSNDRRDDAGPFDVIGDVHGCREELETLPGQPGGTSSPRPVGRA